MLGELRIIESSYLVKSEQRETDRSRKRRMTKPWTRPKYVTVTFPDPDIYQTPQGLICHPLVAKRLRQEIAAMGMMA